MGKVGVEDACRAMSSSVHDTRAQTACRWTHDMMTSHTLTQGMRLVRTKTCHNQRLLTLCASGRPTPRASRNAFSAASVTPVSMRSAPLPVPNSRPDARDRG